MRRTRRQKSQKMHFQEFWNSCAQNKTSEISKHTLSRILGLLCAEQDVGNLNKNVLSGILGLLCAEQNVGNLKKMHFQEFWDSCAQNKASEISKNELSEILGLLCAEQDVGNIEKCIFKNSVTHKTSEISTKLHFQESRDSCAPPRPPKGRSAPLAAVVGLVSLDRVTCP